MPDLSSLAATPSAAQPPVTGPDLTPVPVTIQNLPAALQQLNRPIQINGVVTQLSDPLAILLQTAMGNLTLKLATQVTVDQQKILQQLLDIVQSQKPITLAVNGGASPQQAILLLPVLTASPSPPPEVAAPFSASLQPPVSSPPLPLRIGMTLQAVVLPFPEATAATASPAPENRPAFIPPLELPPQPTPESAQTILSGTPAPPHLADTLRAVLSPIPTPILPAIAEAVAVAKAVPQYAPNSGITLQIQAILLPDTPPPIPQNAQQVIATVVAHGTEGQPIVKADDQLLYIRQPVAIPAGTRIVVTLAPLSPLILKQPDAPNDPVATAVQQMVAALEQTAPAIAQDLFENRIPQPHGNLPATILFFLNAFTLGNAQDWIGPVATEAMRKADKMELISKLTDAFASGGEGVSDKTVGEWKSFPIPLFADGQWETARLYVHNDGSHQSSQQSKAQTNDKSTRFLIDLRLSRLGDVQIDGYSRRKQLDMVVRSEQPLPAGLSTELRSTYTRTLEAVGYAGVLAFQEGRQHWLIFQKQRSERAIVT